MKNADRPAFPVQARGRDESALPGLTKRERFAMAAMQGFCSDHGIYKDICRDTRHKDRLSPETHLAREAIKQADALLAELENMEGS